MGSEPRSGSPHFVSGADGRPRLLRDDLIEQIVLQILSNQRRAPVGDESGRHLGMIDPHRLAPAADVGGAEKGSGLFVSLKSPINET